MHDRPNSSQANDAICLMQSAPHGHGGRIPPLLVCGNHDTPTISLVFMSILQHS